MHNFFHHNLSKVVPVLQSKRLK